jgi:hypothetical protein
MFLHSPGLAGKCFFVWLLFSLVANFTWAQSETATVSGQVVDPSGLNITGAQVKLVDIDRDASTSVTTNTSGLYTFPSVRPGRYRMEVTAGGFKVVNVTGLIVSVQDHLEQNFKLTVGSVSESVTVEGGASLVDTESASVSTVVDRDFAENLPLNGRSFQSLIELTPGVVLTVNNGLDNGQFSVNGQRATSNYWMVDGVSANIGVGTISNNLNPGNGFSGSLGSFSVLGGTNSLVSVDALQEFRIQTSTFAPEFGRTPGGQISIVTRSGTNQFHGTAFDYLRNDVFDANNWFNGYVNNPALPKAKERQNDFGGIFSGPILKDTTFFFFSYEGLRLRLPGTTLTTVPDLSARQNAAPALQAYLNAFPIDPTQPDLGSGVAQFNASYSNPASLDAYSLRVDHRLSSKLALFGRYNYSPSKIAQRGSGAFTLNTVQSASITTQTATAGATWIISPWASNELRFNYSRVNTSSTDKLDSFGGSVPLAALPLQTPYTSQNSLFSLGDFALMDGTLGDGVLQKSMQRQLNVVDSLSFQKGSHTFKVGADFRRLSPMRDTFAYGQVVDFADIPSFQTGSSEYDFIYSNLEATLLFRNLGAYAEDTWRIKPSLTLTYGLRWDVDFTPYTINGPSLLALTGYDLNNLANLNVAPAGTPIFQTRYGNLAPRIGATYQLGSRQGWEMVARGGFGIFYDLASSEVATAVSDSYPFGSFKIVYPGVSFPLAATAATPAPNTLASLSSGGQLSGFDPHLRLPYTLEWNVALEQALGRQQTLSASYIGSSGRRLLQTVAINSPNPSFALAALTGNTATSDYDALQVQFQRRLSHGLQALASYSWSHSIDDASSGSYANTANTGVPTLNPNANRGPSDFDIRNAFSAGLTYEIPAPQSNVLAKTMLHGWSTENFILAHSASPVDPYESIFFSGISNFSTEIRPDVISGIPLYLYGSQYPGGKAFNNTPGVVQSGCSDGSPSIGPFCPPPADANGNPLRQGNLGRNGLRGFGAAQWDFAVHRDFPIHESIKLQFRVEMFNVLNHPNFGQPSGCLGIYCTTPFGLSTQMLGQSLSGGNLGGGAFSPLYQIGGPRSMQFALKLEF